MFMNTIAVGPLDEVASWVIGGTTVAMDRLEGAVGNVCCNGVGRIYMAVVLIGEEVVASLQTCDIGFRNAIVDMNIAGGRDVEDGRNVQPKPGTRMTDVCEQC